MKQTLAVLAFGLAAPSLQGFVRFGCSQITIERLDPLVNPGLTPSPHVHQVVGGDAFKADIAKTDVAEMAQCTTCSFSEDFSNYWTANMYFQARNGSYRRVPQKANRFLTGAAGGITTYYVAPYNGAKVTAFKPGFRMLVGDSTNRKAQGVPRSTCYRCYTGPNFQGDNMAPCADPKLDTKGLPAVPCLGGIRSNIEFPTCWDGVNLDSPDHKSHVAYPASGTFQSGGPCPESHPVKLPQIFLEVVWDTTAFNSRDDWPADGSQPFLLSTGDATGFGQHADYVFGWKGDALQRAMDATNPNSVLKTQSYTVANNCSIPTTVKEDVSGWIPSIPGLEKNMNGE